MLTKISQNKVVKSKSYSKKKETIEQDYLTRKLSKYYREFIIGSNPSEMSLFLYNTLEHSKIAEVSIAKMFEIMTMKAGNPGFDVDTTSLELDGVDYGTIEIRARSLSESYDGRGNGYLSYGFNFITHEEMKKKKRFPADWYFCCGWDSNEDKPVWFRFPRSVALRNKSLYVRQSTTYNGWGWADEYLWSGPS